MEWMLMPYYRYAEFFGRSRRMEFWLFALFMFAVGVAIDIVFGSPRYTRLGMQVGYSTALNGPGEILRSLFGLFNLVPGLAVSVRRLHDADRSGWWLLLWLLPVLGWFVLLVFFCLDGTAGPNRYGVDPQDRGTVDVFR